MVCPWKRLFLTIFIVLVFALTFKASSSNDADEILAGTEINDSIGRKGRLSILSHPFVSTITSATSSAPIRSKITLPLYEDAETKQKSVYLGDPGDPTDRRFIVLILTRLGWSNRLRCIADWHKIALLTGRKLYVMWEKTLDCNIHITEIIESVAKEVIFLPYPEINYMNIESGLINSNMTYRRIADKAKFILGNDETEALYSHDINIVYTFYDGVIALSTMKCQLYQSLHTKFYSSLVPSKKISQIYNFFVDRFLGNLIIGIHIRTHDRTFDWEVVPPIDGSGRANKFGVGADVGDFAKVMQDIILNFSNDQPGRRKDANAPASQVMFFIASNSRDVKEYLVDMFPDNAISLLGSLDRNTTEGMMMAVAEWFILSECDMVINTYGSTFALEAAQKNKAPVLSIHGHKIVYHHDIRLPFCGDLNYLQTYTNNLEVSEYKEGTLDERTVRGKIVTLIETDTFTEWGLPIVYTTINADGQEKETIFRQEEERRVKQEEEERRRKEAGSSL